jgi:hypothetical protein
MREPLLDVNGVTIQYKTPQHLVTATYQVSFAVRARSACASARSRRPVQTA